MEANWLSFIPLTVYLDKMEVELVFVEGKSLLPNNEVHQNMKLG